MAGQILVLTGQIDALTIDKYKKQAKDKNRESWYMAYIMDTDEEERTKGITIEVGRAYFETETTRITILDAPGHKNYIPNMISGASQADIGVVVISARKGEFETGFEKGGQTREHILLAKTLGVSKLIMVVNKMDDQTVNWSKQRYDEIESKMTLFLRRSGYNVKRDVTFLPISGVHGININTRMGDVCPWWNGPCLFDVLDSIQIPPRNLLEGAFRMPINGKFKNANGIVVVMGKVESGSVGEGDSLLLMPNKVKVKVISIYIEGSGGVNNAGPGEDLEIGVSTIEDEDKDKLLLGLISPGSVLSSLAKPIAPVKEFEAQLQIFELVDNAIFTAGYKAMLHIHCVVEECEIIELLHQIDPKTKNRMKKKVVFVKDGDVVLCRVQVSKLICIEKFSEFPQLGRFTLRTKGKTVAVGKVTDVHNVNA